MTRSENMKNLDQNQGSLYKVCLVGDGGVGKTAIVDRYLGNDFSIRYQLTIGAGIRVHTQNIDGKDTKYQIWDLAGQSRFKFVRSSFYRGSHAVIMVFDLARLETLHNLFAWKSEILTNIGYEVPLIVLGNKNDLHEQIENEIVKEAIKKLRYEFVLDEVPYFTTSAFSGQNIVKTFISLGRILNRNPPITLQQPVIVV